MRRILFAILVVAVVLVGIPSSAQANPGDALNRGISGAATGTMTISGATSCLVATQQFDLAIETAQHWNSTLSVDVCIQFIAFPPGGGPVERAGNGTFVEMQPSGAILSGNVRADETGNEFDFALSATSGTRGLQRVTGTLQLSGTFGPVTNSQAPITGTLTSNLTRKP